MTFFNFNFHGVLQIRSLFVKKVELQLIRWVARYPYPLYPREYVYVKRSVVSDDGKDIVIQSKALPESVSYRRYSIFSRYDALDVSLSLQIVPLSGNFVRVECYESRMCVRCHKDFDSPGLGNHFIYLPQIDGFFCNKNGF